MKRFTALTVLMAVLVVPSMLFAANKLAVGEAEVAEGLVTVPLVVDNADGLMAMDLPLSFSEGVILKEVSFEDTRASYFDLKVADIDNDNHRVAIGLITQITATPKAELKAGSGAVANLVFEVVDPELAEISIEAITTTKPDHSLMYIYQVRENGQIVGQEVTEPEFEPVTVSLNSNVVDALPAVYSLAQNYPNPFNPATVINASLAQAGDYRLTIFNVLGQNVEEFTGHAEAGEIQVEWDASRFSSGVYFYKFTAGNFTETRKMMLIK
jgi:hypothetical protein